VDECKPLELGNIYSRITNPTTHVLETRVAQLEGGHPLSGLAVASGTSAGGSLRSSTPPTFSRRIPPPPPHVCMSVDTEGETCSNLGSVLVLNDPPARPSSTPLSTWRRRAGTDG